MKKIIGLTIAAILIIGLAAGGTIAYFSDTESSTGNKFQAGTLDLGLSNTTSGSQVGGATATFSTPTNWKPADTYTVTLYVNNEGTIDMETVTLDFALGALTENTPGTVDPGTDTLADNVYISSATWGGTAVPALALKTLAQLEAAATPYSLGSLSANTEKALIIVFTFESSADNGCQGDYYASVAMNLAGEQSHTGVSYP